jgi:hypothetical protein
MIRGYPAGSGAMQQLGASAGVAGSAATAGRGVAWFSGPRGGRS